MPDRVLMANKCWGNQELFDSNQGPKWTHYEYRDKNGNGVIDPNEPVCKCEHTRYKDSEGENQLKEEGWKELGNAASVYKNLIAGYSRTSDVKPHAMDEFFREFAKVRSSEFTDRFKRERARAEVSHQRNAARDLDLFVRKGIVDFIIALANDSLPVGEPSGWGNYFYQNEEPGAAICDQIGKVFDVASKDGVDIDNKFDLPARYDIPLTASLRKVRKRLQNEGRMGSTHDGIDYGSIKSGSIEDFYTSCVWGRAARND